MIPSRECRMSSFPSACTTLHASPPPREHTCDPGEVMLSQGGCMTIDHGQMLGPELSLMEMSEVEYTHLQHLIQAHMEAHVAPPDVPAARSHPAMAPGSAAISPIVPTQAIDLSTSTDEHYLAMLGEKTPASHGEVPGFVLARVRREGSPTELRANGSSASQARSRSAARVCLEKRFNSLSADAPRQQDIQSAVLTNFLTILQQSTEAQEAVIHPQMHKWMKTDRGNAFEVSNPYAGGVFNPVTNMCEQVIGHNPHVVESSKHQGLIIPESFSLNFRPEMVVMKAHYTSGSSSTEEQQLVNIGSNSDAATLAAFRNRGSAYGSQPGKAASAGPGSAGESGSGTSKRSRIHMSLIQRKERHNSKERERRKRIRLYCDELNMLVPFCEPDTDKVTTLQWTTAFLRYITKTYGDTLKEEYQKAFADGKGRFLKSNPSSDPLHREMDDILSIPLAVEQ